MVSVKLSPTTRSNNIAPISPCLLFPAVARRSNMPLPIVRGCARMQRGVAERCIGDRAMLELGHAHNSRAGGGGGRVREGVREGVGMLSARVGDVGEHDL